MSLGLPEICDVNMGSQAKKVGNHCFKLSSFGLDYSDPGSELQIGCWCPWGDSRHPSPPVLILGQPQGHWNTFRLWPLTSNPRQCASQLQLSLIPDRQTDRQTERLTFRQTYRQTDSLSVYKLGNHLFLFCSYHNNKFTCLPVYLSPGPSHSPCCDICQSNRHR